MAEVKTKVSEKPTKNLSLKLREWGLKQAQGNQKLGLRETGKDISVKQHLGRTPEPAKVVAPQIERTEAGETMSRPQASQKSKAESMTDYTPKKLTKNPERFLQ